MQKAVSGSETSEYDLRDLREQSIEISRDWSNLEKDSKTVIVTFLDELEWINR